MSEGWSAEQLREAIGRCEKQRAEAVERHERPERIDGMGKGLDLLHEMLHRLEREELKHGRRVSP